MKRRNFLKFLAAVPFLGFLKFEQAETPNDRWLKYGIIDPIPAEIYEKKMGWKLTGEMVWLSPNGLDSNDGLTPETAVKSYIRAAELFHASSSKGAIVFMPGKHDIGVQYKL